MLNKIMRNNTVKLFALLVGMTIFCNIMNYGFGIDLNHWDRFFAR